MLVSVYESGYSGAVSGAVAVDGWARVPRWLLLAFYAVVPLSLVVPALDLLALDGGVRAVLPAHPDQILLWTLVFNVPHIIASELILLDREYLSFYRRHIAIAVTGVALLTFLSSEVLGPVAVVWLGLVLVSYHIIGQQVGIARLMSVSAGWSLDAWKVLGTASYLMAFAQGFYRSPVFREFGAPVAAYGYALWLPMAALAFHAYRRAQDRRGRAYVLANQVMFMSFIPLATLGYGFFVVVMVRVVHDLSAFCFYLVHDANRNRERAHNLLYRALAFTRLPRWVIAVGVSVGVGHWLVVIDSPELLHPVGMVSVFHYYMEAVTWRGSGLHRHSIALA